MSSHINEAGFPRMVDVGHKSETRRRAVATGTVVLPGMTGTVGEEWYSPKGPVFQTAVIAGIQGAKSTSALIPLCHPLPLSRCDVAIRQVPSEGNVTLRVFCTVETTARTGVEMEALTGVSVACLTIYDMGKSVVLGIEITDIHLLEKTGGKHDWNHPGASEYTEDVSTEDVS
jgi:cyclic pyranopterin phosphate synthase